MASKKPSRTSFDIKSANLSHITLILKSSNLDILETELANQFGNTSDYFDNDPVLIDFSEIPGSASNQPLDVPRLVKILKAMHMAPFATRHATAELTQAVRSAGLIALTDTLPSTAGPAAAAQPSDMPQEEQTATDIPTITPDLAAHTTPCAASVLIVDKPLRSGQQIYAREADLIITSVVSFGAEIIADGNIHVYAPLRGRVIAGAQGNTHARIFSTCFEPALFSIAGIFQTTDKPLPANILGKPAMVHLEGESLIVTPMATNL